MMGESNKIIQHPTF